MSRQEGPGPEAGAEPGTSKTPRRHRALPFVAGLSAAGAIGVGFLNVFGVSTGVVVNFVAVALLVGAFVGSMSEILRAHFPDYSRRTKSLFVIAVAAAAAVLVAVGLATRAAIPLHRLPGTHDIAVVGFHPSDADGPKSWEGLGASVALALTKPGGGEVHDYSGEVNPPLERLASSADDGQLATWTSDFVTTTGAELVIAGWEVGSHEAPAIAIAAYLPPELVPDAVELSGWFKLDTIGLDSSLSSPTARKEFTDSLDKQVGALSKFAEALDEWHAGHPSDAARDFGAVKLSDPEQSPTLVALSHLLRGHALESQAVISAGEAKLPLLDEARAEYEAARSSPNLSRRVDLSIATNDFLKAASPGCQPREGLIDQLSAIAERLGAIAGPTPRDLVSLRADTNLVQVHLCRAVAGAQNAYSAAQPILDRLTTLKPTDGVTQQAVNQLRSLALSTQATMSGLRGQYAAAVTAIEQAIELDTRFERRALWLGLESRWLLQDCKQQEGAAAQERSLSQLDQAISRGRVSPEERSVYDKDFANERTLARSHCPG